MLENFSQSALKIVMFAQEEVRKANGHVVNTEHLLMGLIRERDCIAFQTLVSKGIKAENIQQQLSKLRLPKRPSSLMEIHFSESIQKVFEIAEEEASILKDKQVHSEHLLLGMLTLGTGKGNQILKNLGFNLKQIRWNILRIRRERDADNVNTPTLNSYSEDLTQLLEGSSKSVVEWKILIEEMIQYLGLAQKHSILLVGERGIGKSSLIHGLTQYILESRIYPQFSHYRVVCLDFDRMIAEAQTDETLYERTKSIIGELKQSSDIILVIENIHQLFLANKKEMEFVITQYLITYLEDSQAFCIATTYPNYYSNLIKNSPIEDFFQILAVPEPSEEFTKTVLKHWTSQIEDHHQIEIEQDCLELVIQQSKLNKNAYLPASAIRLLDLKASKKRWEQVQKQQKCRHLGTRLRQLWAQIEQLALKQEEEKIIKVKADINKLEAQLRHYQILTAPDLQLTLKREDFEKTENKQD